MAVYTDISGEQLAEFVARYDIGTVLSFKGIAEGVENSNYHLRTSQGRFILTIYEKRVDPADLPFFLGLMEHLGSRGLQCPRPVAARDGAARSSRLGGVSCGPARTRCRSGRGPDAPAGPGEIRRRPR